MEKTNENSIYMEDYLKIAGNILYALMLLVISPIIIPYYLLSKKLKND